MKKEVGRTEKEKRLLITVLRAKRLGGQSPEFHRALGEYDRARAKHRRKKVAV